MKHVYGNFNKFTFQLAMFFSVGFFGLIAEPMNRVDEPNIVMDASGNVTAVWSYVSAGTKIIQAASMQVGQSWSVPISLSGTLNQSIKPKIVGNMQGDKVVLWSDYAIETANDILAASIFDSSKGTWGDSVIVSTVNEMVLDDFHVVINEDRIISVIWKAILENPNVQCIRSSNTTVSSGEWSIPVNVSSSLP